MNTDSLLMKLRRLVKGIKLEETHDLVRERGLEMADAFDLLDKMISSGEALPVDWGGEVGLGGK